LLDRAAVQRIVRTLAGRAIVVVDEAYVDFSGQPSLAAEIPANPNLVVLRTLSKAFGLAGARVGTTLADPAVIGVLQKVIAPYPIPSPVLAAALAALTPAGLAAAQASVATIVTERHRLALALARLPVVKKIWPSDTNYLLIAVPDAARAMAAARATGVIWRDRSKDVPHTIRITIGSAEENNETLEVLSRV
jgi:histidinol-phosphate aminotransferase